MTMTNVYPEGKNPQTIALAFAVASLQNPSIGLGLHQEIPQALLDAANNQREARKKNTEKDIQPTAGPLQPRTSCQGANADDTDVDDDSGDGGVSAVGENDDDTERRLARSRERNREHARRTRLRKKAQLEALQSKVKGLEAERQVLKQKVEECGIASILLGLSAGGEQDSATQNLLSSATGSTSDGHTSADSSCSEKKVSSCGRSTDMVAILSGSKRKRFISEAIGEQPGVMPQQRLTINIDGHVTEIGAGKSHINWKTGVYRDQQGVQRQLTPQQLEDLRRERNRMHAKMTRSRKKCFIVTIQKAIDDLETENQRMRDILEKVSVTMVTPATSPQLSPKASPIIHEEHEDNDNRPVYSHALPPAPPISTSGSAFEPHSPHRATITITPGSSCTGGSRPLKKRKANHGFLLDG